MPERLRFPLTQLKQALLQAIIQWRLDPHHFAGAGMRKGQRRSMQEKAF